MQFIMELYRSHTLIEIRKYFIVVQNLKRVILKENFLKRCYWMLNYLNF